MPQLSFTNVPLVGAGNFVGLANYTRMLSDRLSHESVLHTYFRNDADNLSEYFGVIVLKDAFIREVVAICDAVAAKWLSYTSARS